MIALILDAQAWTQPICVERETLAVLDGHHRLAAAIQLGLTRIPCRTYDYATVPLASWRPEIEPTRDEVLHRALTGRLYPPKTTRHTFTRAPDAAVGLARLVGPGGAPPSRGRPDSARPARILR